MNKLHVPFTLVALVLFATLSAQDYYSAFVGSFVNARPQDFAEARSLGFIYTQTNTDQLEEVYLGQYPSQEKAASIVQSLQDLGFSNAQVVSGYYGNPADVAVIQIATRYNTKNIDWAKLSNAGSLNVLLADGNIKVLSGTFLDVDAAKAELPKIRSLGYSDAFVKVVKRGQLLPVTAIATGIKENLIPLELSDAPVPAPAPPQTTTSTVRPEPTNTGIQPNSGTRVPSEPTAVIEEPEVPYVPRPAEATPSTIPAEAAVTTAKTPAITTAGATPNLPSIRGDVKRNTVTDLQGVLKAEGYYTSTLDGYYGGGTTSAYERMLKEDQQIQKYRLLVPHYASRSNQTNDAFGNWVEIQLLQTIAYDIAPRQASLDTERKEAQSLVNELATADNPIGPTQATLLETWQNNLWRNINAWPGDNTYLQKVVGSLRFTYLQSAVRLEDYYMDKGFTAAQARPLAIATLRAMLEVPLEQFE